MWPELLDIHQINCNWLQSIAIDLISINQFQTISINRFQSISINFNWFLKSIYINWCQLTWIDIDLHQYTSIDCKWLEGFLSPSVVLNVWFVMKWMHKWILPCELLLQILVQMNIDTQYNNILWRPGKWFLLLFNGCLDFCSFINLRKMVKWVLIFIKNH